MKNSKHAAYIEKLLKKHKTFGCKTVNIYVPDIKKDVEFYLIHDEHNDLEESPLYNNYPPFMTVEEFEEVELWLELGGSDEICKMAGIKNFPRW